eukprot:Clim_evm33s172 gene=Clim_evmTU33s172
MVSPSTAVRKAVFVVAAKRTAFGTFGGALGAMSATDLAAHATKATMEAGKIDPSIVDTVIVGNVAQTSADAAYLARHAALKAGVPIDVPALTVNRLCGSGFQAVINGYHEIVLGEASVALVGGTESMSQAPHVLRGARFGNPRLGQDLKLEDSLWSALTDSYAKMPMAITAENLAEKYNISKEECDAFALRSQQLWGKANEAGAFKAEIAPMTLKVKRKEVTFDTDEHPRPHTTKEGLAKLPPIFKENGTVSAGNASGICDGAAMLALASEEAVKQHNLCPLARITGYGVSGCDPKIMGIGPVPAAKKAMAMSNTKIDDFDLVEVNEAFAAQALSVAKELGIDHNKFNLQGGAIALGHPLGASGGRITGHLTHMLHFKEGANKVLGAACIGGGQGIAISMEKA